MHVRTRGMGDSRRLKKKKEGAHKQWESFSFLPPATPSFILRRQNGISAAFGGKLGSGRRNQILSNQTVFSEDGKEVPAASAFTSVPVFLQRATVKPKPPPVTALLHIRSPAGQAYGESNYMLGVLARGERERERGGCCAQVETLGLRLWFFSDYFALFL